jgi:hypothetical protein
MSGQNRAGLDSLARPDLGSLRKLTTFSNRHIVTQNSVVQNFTVLTNMTAAGNQAILQPGSPADVAVLP